MFFSLYPNFPPLLSRQYFSLKSLIDSQNSRAFGDTELKRHQFVISTPEIRRVDLSKQPLRYVLLASDGFWDVVTSHEAVLEVNYLLRHEFGKRRDSGDKVQEDSENLQEAKKASPDLLKNRDLGAEEVKKISPVKEVLIGGKSILTNLRSYEQKNLLSYSDKL